MEKVYSNKALPPGTVLREWRLEEVLGVGGFGIVYRGRGIYFDELVAIKEYFPSSISERDAEDTVVAIDSDAEEVHALGLKKFVEEAKLLWNLSTPTRHPNIVNVRSLFEIHGTAYMVMDFEDGVSLSKMLKQGTRFNERSLVNIVRPIAEGLERAHRVGVLHRDIKPPNILINPDGRPVLIDFGSARFEAAEATSTSVTFHTPPYAALEQYVKTYQQGPWTDIYALGVVLHECVTGKKPPEVLERMHGSLGQPLADSHWPGYSHRFLATIDAAMTIRPDDRPRSIAAWLATFDDNKSDAPTTTVTVDEDATRFATYDHAVDKIQPVDPPAPELSRGEELQTGVPDNPNAVKFKLAGADNTATGKRRLSAELAPPDIDIPAPQGPAASEEPVEALARPTPTKPSASKVKVAAPGHDPIRRLRSQKVIGGAALLVLAVAAGGWALRGSADGSDTAAVNSEALAPSAIADDPDAGMAFTQLEGLSAAARALANDARAAGASAAAIDPLVNASDDLATQFQTLQSDGRDPAKDAAAQTAATAMRTRASSANLTFVESLLREAEVKALRLSSSGAGGRNSAANAASESAVSKVERELAQLRDLVTQTRAATDPDASMGGARQALTQWQSLMGAWSIATRVAEARAQPAIAVPSVKTVLRPEKLRSAARPSVTATQPQLPAPAEVAASSSKGLSPTKSSQLAVIVEDGRRLADSIIRGGGSNKATVQLAKTYKKYLGNLKNSMRRATSDKEADRLIAHAEQTRAYLTFLVKRSSAAQ